MKKPKNPADMYASELERASREDEERRSRWSPRRVQREKRVLVARYLEDEESFSTLAVSKLFTPVEMGRLQVIKRRREAQSPTRLAVRDFFASVREEVKSRGIKEADEPHKK